MEIYEISASPFTGNMLKSLIRFLSDQGLEYDEQIEYSVVFMEEDIIVGTGSIHENIIKCIAVSPKYRGHNLLGKIMTHLVSYLTQEGICHYFGFTKPGNKELFCNMGLYPVAETEHVLLLENKRNGLKKYMDILSKETEAAYKNGIKNETGHGVASIVANCNPFSKGHKYLVEKAAQECEWVHVFILSSGDGMFTSQDRYNMVWEGIAHLPNVILHKTSDYIISPVVFPTYFIKEKAQALSINCMLDITIFGKYIAKALGIQIRYVGEEPYCQVTRTYNKLLQDNLPVYGIKVREIPRLSCDDIPISASKIREWIRLKAWKEAAEVLPETSVNYMKEKRLWS